MQHSRDGSTFMFPPSVFAEIEKTMAQSPRRPLVRPPGDRAFQTGRQAHVRVESASISAKKTSVLRRP
uniref:DUF397 domain-containing protein n=1 Tax=Steinernema glaseri TaxID=37863 RepID=A0A1I7XXI5_9BILA